MKNLLFLFLFFIGMSLAACGGGESNDGGDTSGEPTSESSNNGNNSESDGGETTDGEPQNLEEAMQQAQKAIEESGMGNKDEVLNFRELQKRLPEKLAGMERTSKGGQTAGAMGMNVSTAEAKYKADDGTLIKITLTDTGGLGMGMMAAAAWSTATIDREDENGSERTSSLDGFKSFEKTTNRNNACELSVIAKGRYIAVAECTDCKMDVLKKAVRGMDLNDLPEKVGEK